MKPSTEICKHNCKIEHTVQHKTPSINVVGSANIDDYASANKPSEWDDVRVNLNEDAAKIIEPSVDSGIGVRRSGRIKNAPGPWWANTASIATSNEPISFHQAITCDDAFDDAPHWKSTISTEFQSLKKQNTWNLATSKQEHRFMQMDSQTRRLVGIQENKC
jgi:hypothetical protein